MTFCPSEAVDKRRRQLRELLAHKVIDKRLRKLLCLISWVQVLMSQSFGVSMVCIHNDNACVHPSAGCTTIMRVPFIQNM
jgi:hypothetical protein